jgi:DNA-binding NtrC family response regulator
MSSNHATTAECFGQPFSTPLDGDPRDPESEAECRHDQQGPVLLGESVAVRRLRSQIQRIAPYFRIALLRGEMGCGKELVARAIHALSPCADGPFVVTQAATLAESVATGEQARPGHRWTAASLLDSADGGTLYLRGVDKLTFSLQDALLQFLGEYGRRRGTPPRMRLARFDPSARRTADMRIVAACDRDLRTLAAIGQFRQDLYAQVSAAEIFVPPLRQRTEDISLLGQWLLRRLAEATGQAPKLLAEETVSRLQEHLWPNNLRELERALCQAAALAEGALIEPRHLLEVFEPVFGDATYAPAVKVERLHDVIQQHVFGVLARCGGNKLRAAEMLGISRSTLYRMLDAGRPQAR